MNIKIEPFKNNIGASISYNLKLVDSKIIDQIKETLNNYVLACFRLSSTNLILGPISGWVTFCK